MKQKYVGLISIVLPYGLVLAPNVLSGPLLGISSFYKACISARVQIKQVFAWSHDYVLAHHWLFRSVASFASVRGYSGSSYIRRQ